MFNGMSHGAAIVEFESLLALVQSLDVGPDQAQVGDSYHPSWTLPYHRELNSHVLLAASTICKIY